MVTRHDAVLTVIPLLAVSGPLVAWIARSVDGVVGVGTDPALAAGGLLALGVIVHETVAMDPAED